jgi:hypothetical protein
LEIGITIALVTLSLSILGVVWNGATKFGKINAELEYLKERHLENTKFTSIDQRLVRIEDFIDSWLRNVSPPTVGGSRGYDKKFDGRAED